MSWFIIVVCWFVSFIFNGIEAGLLSLDQVRLRHQVKLRNPSAIRLDRLLKKPERLLATILLVTNFADIAGLLLLTQESVQLLGAPGYAVALLVAAPIYLFLLGVLPKSLFRRFPYRALAALAGVLVFTSRAVWPILALGAFIGRLFFRRTEARPRLFAAREDLKQLTVESERQGALTSVERELIHNVVDFRTVKVSDVMVPRQKVIAIQPGTSIPDLLELSRRTSIDRIPILTENDRALGLVNVLDILLDQSPPRALPDSTRPIVSAVDTESAYRTIRRLRAAQLTLAAVFDEKTKFAGVVTLEDLVRRLVQSGQMTPAAAQ
jgi:CBS domain containing-hemolysin-like protein